MDKNIVAYIDLLGSSNHLKDNTSDEALNDALMVMQNYNNTLSVKKIIGNSFDSFDYFIPFSDAIFLMSSDCSSFIKQLGSFVFQSFNSSSHFYEFPNDPTKPEKVSFFSLSLTDDGILDVNQKTRRYYPVLFRGGLAYGKASPIELYSILDKKPTKSKVITGKAVVDAVSLESKVKGPRLIFHNDVYDQLDVDARDYCRVTPENKEMYEILWPAMIYIEQNKEHDIDQIHRVLNPAYNLWKAYNHMPYSYHYYNFIELIVASTIQFFDRKCGLKEVAKNEIKRLINNNDLKYKINLNNY